MRPASHPRRVGNVPVPPGAPQYLPAMARWGCPPVMGEPFYKNAAPAGSLLPGKGHFSPPQNHLHPHQGKTAGRFDVLPPVSAGDFHCSAGLPCQCPYGANPGGEKPGASIASHPGWIAGCIPCACNQLTSPHGQSSPCPGTDHSERGGHSCLPIPPGYRTAPLHPPVWRLELPPAYRGNPPNRETAGNKRPEGPAHRVYEFLPFSFP